MTGKPLRWMHGEVKTPPVSLEARREIGFLLRELQDGVRLAMPQSRPMPVIGSRCHELRVNDVNKTWRVMYRLDADAILILEVFEKKTNHTPPAVIAACRQRLQRYEGTQQ
ncbi:MAG: type II toxin-antitoxin system RelE/ParE family toxin [Verrucomicrobiota bacterium]